MNLLPHIQAQKGSEALPQPGDTSVTTPMIVFINGRLVAESEARISVFDRGFLYGDGLFETLAAPGGRLFGWEDHWDRFSRGAEFLKIKVPFTADQMKQFAAELLRANGMTDAVLRLVITRGPGPRGYSTKGADQPTVVMSLHRLPRFDPAWPPRWRLLTSSIKVPARDPLAAFKTANKLPHILARQESEAAGADEALLLNTEGCVAEATTSNVFWIKDGIVATPPLRSGALAGITRSLVIRMCNKLDIPIVEVDDRPTALLKADTVFLTQSVLGLIELESLDQQRYQPSPLVRRLQAAYHELLTEF